MASFLVSLPCAAANKSTTLVASKRKSQIINSTLATSVYLRSLAIVVYIHYTDGHKSATPVASNRKSQVITSALATSVYLRLALLF